MEQNNTLINELQQAYVNAKNGLKNALTSINAEWAPVIDDLEEQKRHAIYALEEAYRKLKADLTEAKLRHQKILSEAYNAYADKVNERKRENDRASEYEDADAAAHTIRKFAEQRLGIGAGEEFDYAFDDDTIMYVRLESCPQNENAPEGDGSED